MIYIIIKRIYFRNLVRKLRSDKTKEHFDDIVLLIPYGYYFHHSYHCNHHCGMLLEGKDGDDRSRALINCTATMKFRCICPHTCTRASHGKASTLRSVLHNTVRSARNTTETHRPSPFSFCARRESTFSLPSNSLQLGIIMSSTSYVGM